jgi:hypothetical protein
MSAPEAPPPQAPDAPAPPAPTPTDSKSSAAAAAPKRKERAEDVPDAKHPVYGRADCALITLRSAKGQSLLSEAERDGTAATHAAFARVFRKQIGETACGVATAAVVLRAARDLNGVSAPSPDPLEERRLLDGLPAPADKTLTWQRVNSDGLTYGPALARA